LRPKNLVCLQAAKTENPISLTDPEEEDPSSLRRPLVAPSTDREEAEYEVESDEIWSPSTYKTSMAIAFTSLSILAAFIMYGLIDFMGEIHMKAICVFALVSPWYARLNGLKKEGNIFIKIASVALRIAAFILIVTICPWRLDTFVFLHERMMLWSCAAYAIAAVIGHYLLNRGKRRDQSYPDAGFFAGLFTVEVDDYIKLEKGLSLARLFVTDVVIRPFFQEILYRGVVVTSLWAVWGPCAASLVGALAHNISQPFESFGQQASLLLSGFIWGLLLFNTQGNLMYPFVAHMMHNAILFSTDHYSRLVE